MATPAKKMKLSSQKYRIEYGVTWPCLGPSKKSEGHVYCSICNSDFTVSHGGKCDCRRHMESKAHLELTRLQNSNHSLTAMFKTPNSSLAEKHRRTIIRSEAMLISVISELNLSLSSADLLTKVIQEMCPDSKIASGKPFSVY